MYAEDGKAFVPSRLGESAIQSDEFQRLWIAIGGHQRGAELESVGGAQWMVHDDALSVKAGSDYIRDFNPS